MANVKISALPDADANPVSGDFFPAVTGGVTKRFDYDDISAAVQADVDAAVISSSKYTPIAPTSSTVTFSDTSDLTVGDAIKMVQNDSATPKYMLVTAIVANTSITISGPALATNPTTITSIARLSPSRVVQVDLFFPGLFMNGGATTTLLARETRTLFRWQQPTAYLVYAAARQATADSSAANQGVLNFQVDGTDAFSTNLTLPNATTWQGPTAGDVDKNNYTLSFASAIEVDLVTAAGNLDARDLLVALTMILN